MEKRRLKTVRCLKATVTGTSGTAILRLGHFRNFVKNSNPLCDVALGM